MDPETRSDLPTILFLLKQRHECSVLQVVPSADMLSMCFNNLFTQLPQQRVNLDSLMLTWLTLNEETFLEVKAGDPQFDPSRVPSIPLNQVRKLDIRHVKSSHDRMSSEVVAFDLRDSVTSFHLRECFTIF